MRKLTSEFNGKTTEELNKEIANVQKEIVVAVSNQKVNKPKDTNSLSKKRQKLAVLLTIKRSKELTG